MDNELETPNVGIEDTLSARIAESSEVANMPPEGGHATDQKHEATATENLDALLEKVPKLDLEAFADTVPGGKIKDKHLQILTVETIQKLAVEYDWDICINNGHVYFFESQYWQYVDKNIMTTFLAKGARAIGVEKFTWKYHNFQKGLLKQFMAQAFLPRPKRKESNIKITLMNGTYEFSKEGGRLTDFDKRNFHTYRLPFNYDPAARAPMFQAFLDHVLPDIQCQKVLAEFIASVFVKRDEIKLEKALMLYGEGANGKSVFFDLICALLHEKNVSNYSIQSLMDEKGYSRADLPNKLLNYSSEMIGQLEAGIFKTLTSREPVSARMIYRQPVMITDYAKLAFNCNTLPKNVEHTAAYFRRFLIIPFLVQIPEDKQDKKLAQKIIAAGELSGIFNWVLEGLNRLIEQGDYSPCDAAAKELNRYQTESDTVQTFLNERRYVKSINDFVSAQSLSNEYGEYCKEFRFRPLNHTNFVNRLRTIGFEIGKKRGSLVVYLHQQPAEPEPSLGFMKPMDD